MKNFKSVIRSVVNKAGYDIVRAPVNEPKNVEFCEKYGYGIVRPNATYCPWEKDQIFKDVFETIQGLTLVDEYRCFELWQLVEQSSKLRNGSIIEIGVWRGGTGGLIAKKANMCGIREKVYLCDTFTGVVKAGKKDSEYKGGEHSDTNKELVEELILSKMKLENVEILEGIFPDQTGHSIEDLKFRFCHVDVDVYQSAKDIVSWIWNRLVQGGIMVYDDYGFIGCDGVTKCVEEQMAFNDRLVLHNLNGHATVIKLK